MKQAKDQLEKGFDATMSSGGLHSSMVWDCHPVSANSGDKRSSTEEVLNFNRVLFR
jgi:hypothetical protein